MKAIRNYFSHRGMAAGSMLCVVSGTALGDTVNVDIQGAGTGGPGFNLNVGTYAGTAAAPSTGTVWNAFQFNNTLAANILDDQGATSDVSIWLQGVPAEWSYANGNTLMGDYTFSWNAWANNAGERFTIFSNVADGGTGMQLDGSKAYDIYVYTMGDVANQHATFQLNSSSGTPIVKTATGNGPFGGAFVEGGNYVKFSNVSPRPYDSGAADNGFEFELYWGHNGNGPAAINGFQIVETDVPANPVFSEVLADQSVSVGQEFVFNGQAVGAPTISYLWEYSLDGVSSWTTVGTDSPTFGYPSAIYGDNGYYRVTATNPNSSVTSAVAHLVVTYPNPQITAQPASVAAYEGGDATLAVAATTVDAPEYQWFKGTSGDTSMPLSEEIFESLVFTDLQLSDAGDYWVQVTDTAAEDDSMPAKVTNSDTATIQVLAVPEVSSVQVDIQGATAGGPGLNLNIGTYNGTAAAPSTGTVWNAFQFNNTFSPTLPDDQGVATDVQVWLEGNPDEFSYANSNTLMGDYAFAGADWENNGGRRMTIFSNQLDGGVGMQIDGTKTYDIYLYTMGDSAGQQTTFQLNHAGGSTVQTATGDGPFGGTFVEGENYLKFTNVTPKSYANGYEFEIFWGRAAGNTTSAALNGFQIVETAVPAIPSFVSQPQDHTGFVGAPFNLTGQAVGVPTLTYLWEYSEDGIGGWTTIGSDSPFYGYASAIYADNGYYRVTATNANGSTTSPVAHVIVTYPDPVINAQPQSAIVYEGNELNLSVVATTIDAAGFQWYKGTSGDTTNPLSGETLDTLTISNLQMSDAGEYWVRVTDSAATSDGFPATSTDSAGAVVQVFPPRSDVAVLIDFDAAVGAEPSTTATPADFTAAGVPMLTAADPVSHPTTPTPVAVETGFIELTDGLTVTLEEADLSGGCNGAYSVNNGSPLLNDYLFLQNGSNGAGPTIVTVSGLNLEASSTYTLYVFGVGDGVDQVSVFTPVDGTNVTFDSTSPFTGDLAVTFSTGPGYAGDDLVFGWERAAGSIYAPMNGIAIVPGELVLNDYAAWISEYSGVGTMTGFDEDPDGDGLTNGLENFLGTDPSVSNSGVVAVSKSGNVLSFQHPQGGASASDVIGAYLWSTDLSTFHADGESAGGTTVVFSPVADSPSVGTTTVTATISGAVPSTMFVVVSATRAP